MRNWKDFFGNLFSKQFENGGVTGRDFIDEARLRSKDTPEEPFTFFFTSKFWTLKYPLLECGFSIPIALNFYGHFIPNRKMVRTISQGHFIPDDNSSQVVTYGLAQAAWVK